MMAFKSAHPGESRDPVLSSLTPARQDTRARITSSTGSPKALGPGFRRDERNERTYFFPGGVVKGEAPTDTAGLGFSALGLRVSLLLRT